MVQKVQHIQNRSYALGASVHRTTLWQREKHKRENGNLFVSEVVAKQRVDWIICICVAELLTQTMDVCH